MDLGPRTEDFVFGCHIEVWYAPSSSPWESGRLGYARTVRVVGFVARTVNENIGCLSDDCDVGLKHSGIGLNTCDCSTNMPSLVYHETVIVD